MDSERSSSLGEAPVDPAEATTKSVTTAANDGGLAQAENFPPSMDVVCEETSAFTDEEAPGIMKPDIVFFGESLGDLFHSSVAGDKEKADLLIMIGSSLKVRPVALIPSAVPETIPQVRLSFCFFFTALEEVTNLT
jgi:NAD-dependent SIR2 family protein deacetylase